MKKNTAAENESYDWGHLFQLVRFRVLADLRGEVSGAYAGWLWWILEPLIYLSAFYVIFDLIFQRGGPGFVGFLLCGLVFWRWFDSSIKKSAGAIMANTALIQQAPIPKILFPLTELAASFCRFLFVLVLFIIFLLFYKNELTMSLLYLPILLLAQGLLIMGAGILLAAVIPFAPDLRKLLDHAMTLGFYLSGIFFSIDELPEAFQSWLYLNPMAVLIEQYRLVLLDGLPPQFNSIVVVALAGLIMLGFGVRLINRYDSFYASQIS
ncbi:MAG: ABC transporter permease [Pseudomonadales bacterium]